MLLQVVLVSLMFDQLLALPRSALHQAPHNISSHVTSNDELFERSWEDYKLEYRKSYSDNEEGLRKEIFRQNVENIEAHNVRYQKGLESFYMGINEFTDMKPDEFLKTMTGFRPMNVSHVSNGSAYLSPLQPLQLPKTIDWRTKGYVTRVKNQGSCGSCWAFSTTGSMEGQHFRKSGKLVSLSEQQLVDCSPNDGCGGGWMNISFQYINSNGGIDTEMSYPYKGVEQKCRFDPLNVGATCTGYVNLPQNSESKLQEAVATVGPVSVAIDASGKFQSYAGGVLVDKTCTPASLDHAVLVVGYGTHTDGKEYWLVKNSWGAGWGMDGYIMMARNYNNMCGIAAAASYPLV